MHTIKKQLLFLSLAAAVLLAGCAKNEIDGGGQTTPATHISAKARGAASITVDTKGPVTGTSLNGQTADIYVSTYEIASHRADLDVIFSNVYGRGTMTFDDNNYVVYDKADFGGKDGGNSLLPQDGKEIYAYGFYPKGWNRTVENINTENHEVLGCTLDGKTDAMSTRLKNGDEITLKFNDLTFPDKADFIFKHLLTRYNIRVKANDATAITAWGRVKSVKIKEATVVNRVAWFKDNSSAITSFHYDNDGTALTPTAFYKLTGADVAKPTYSDDKFEAADYAASQVLTTNEANACYTMIAPVNVADANPLTEELTLEVVTITADNKEKITMVPVSLQQNKFVAADNYSTRGYAITLALNFRAGAIQAIASVEHWKEYGNQNIDIDMTEPVVHPKIGDLKGGGIVYEINGSKAKVLSLDEGLLEWAVQNTYVIGADGQSDTDGKANSAAMKTYSANTVANSTTGIFATDFPAANFCDKKNTGGVTGWYLPAKEELKALSTAYQIAANKTAIDAGIANNSGTAITASGDFWSSTENSSYTSGTWYIDFSYGGTSTIGKSSTYYVRCVREL